MCKTAERPSSSRLPLFATLPASGPWRADATALPKADNAYDYGIALFRLQALKRVIWRGFARLPTDADRCSRIWFTWHGHFLRFFAATCRAARPAERLPVTSAI